MRTRKDKQAPITPLEAFHLLQSGNQRFINNLKLHQDLLEQVNETKEGQYPFAIVLSCMDSRISNTLIFDQGLGDLFVIRIAGNVVAASQIGSVEFAAERYSAPLVVVLGHSQCGAVQATLEEVMRPTQQQSPHLRSIVERVRPSVESLLATNLRDDPHALIGHAVRANVRVSANQLRNGSQILEQRIQQGRLLVVGAEYSLETGEVDFFDGLPAGAEEA